ncbi:MAG: nicotinate-nucleotide adenylyltransferase [Clostridia bacterium]|nr:nicotinate-nucleotide adenylyltransferase [Clostridia bacterium]
MEKIGIFGGTYNPPHVGHLNIAEQFVEAYGLDRLLIIPTYVPPHKVSPNLASCEDRIAMCNATFTDPVYEVSTIEIGRKGKSYTHDTLKELKGIYKDAKFYFLCGDDMLLSLHTWYKPKDILKYCTIVAAVRTDGLSYDVLKDYAVSRYRGPYEGGKIQFLEIDPMELSSTEIRNKIKSGEKIDKLVTKETLAYINSRGLYSD